MEKIILGIDPGTNIMGYGLIKVVDGKAQMLSMRMAVKARYPQYEWIKYGVQDKR